MVEIKLTFKDGGAFDFHTKYERLRERLQQVAETTRLGGEGSSSAGVAMNVANAANVNLEDLPAYQEESDGPLIAPTAAAAIVVSQHSSPVLQQQRDSGVSVDDDRPQPKPTDNAFSPPDEPPPGYEETQMAGLQNELDARLRDGRQ